MKKIILVLIIGLVIAPAANAVPDLQLFIDGATYDGDTETWVLATTGGVDLYVISANEEHYDVIVSMSLIGFGEFDDPSVVSVSGFDNTPSAWTWGFAPVFSAPEFDNNEDVPPHGIWPTWYAEDSTGHYYTSDFVGDVQPDENTGEYWSPAPDPEYPGASANASGSYKLFSLSIDAPVGTALHFDAYTLINGELDEFAPFSHDATATVVPEPGTILLMSTGLLGLGLSAIRRRKR